MNKFRLLSRMMVLLGLAFITIACTQAPPPQTSTTPTANTSRPTASPELQPTATGTLTGMMANADNVGPVPKDCPPGPAPRSVDPSEFGPGVGGSPVWAIAFEGPHATVHLNGDLSDVHGWGVMVIWVVGPYFTINVSVH